MRMAHTRSNSAGSNRDEALRPWVKLAQQGESHGCKGDVKGGFIVKVALGQSWHSKPAYGLIKGTIQ